MKATDLMIGDLLLYKGQPIKVEEILIDGINPDWDGNENYGNEARYEDLQPIPITPEILKKNGFKYSEWYGWQIKEPDFTLCFVGDTPHFLLDDIFVCDCPYVHTLQHALKLCGIEKKIVL